MSKKLRYIILGICFVIFFVLAPLLVLFVRGLSYEGDGSGLNKTGILVVETEPEDAEVFLNGEQAAHTPASIRFLKPGDYTVRLHKTGYFDWQKKLTVLEGKVLWVSAPSKITLLKNDTAPETITAGAYSFAMLSNERLAYTSGNNLVLLSGENFTETKTATLSEPMSAINPSPSGARIVVNGNKTTSLIHTESLAVTDISTLVAPKSIVHFVSDNEALVLAGEVLERTNFESQTKSELFSGIQSFATADDRLYLLQKTKDGNRLLSTLLNAPENPQIILEQIPAFNRSEIYVTLGRQALLLGDNTLYRIGNTLEEIASNIQNAAFNQSTSSLIFTMPGELDYYNFEENKIKLISRSNEPFTNIALRRDLNYAFYIQRGNLYAIELDDRDRQNSYALATFEEPKKFYFAGDKYIILQDGDALTKITVQ